MQRGILKFLVTLPLLCGIAFSQAKIIHSPSREVYAGSPILIEAIIDRQVAEVQDVKILFREAGQDAFIEDNMNEVMGVYKYNIPAKFVTENGLEYLITAEFADGSMAAFPEVDPYNVPMFLSVRRKIAEGDLGQSGAAPDLQGGAPSDAIILSPEEAEIVASSEIVIAVSLFNARNVSLNTIKVEIDGIDITGDAQISEDLIVARPKNLSPGSHSIRVTFANTNGVYYNPLLWNVTVVGSVREAEKIFNYNGRVLAEVTSEQVRGITQNIQQVTTGFNGSYDWLKFNVNLFKTSEENRFRQPRDRYTAGFSSNYFEMNFGDFNPQFSEFGLRGKRVRGVEAHLKLRYFNLHVVSGETERTIAGEISETPDTLADGLLEYSRSGYTYDRNILAIRPYFGSGRHFQFGINFIKVKDDTLSVNREMGGIFNDNTHRIVMAGEKPKDNIVIGTDLKLAFDNQRFVWKNAVAISMLNRDITGGALSKDDTLALGDFNIPISTLGFDPSSIENIFTINLNMYPISPITLDSLENVKNPLFKIQLNDSTYLACGMQQVLNMPSTAFRSALNLNYFNNYVTIKYQHIGSSFYSLANPYMRNDIQGFYIADKIRLFQNKVFLNISFEQNRDNLNDDKKATTTTTSFMAGLSLFLGENLPRIDLNTMQYGRKNDLTQLDTTWYGTEADSFSIKDNRESNLTMRQDIRISHNVEFMKVKNTLNLSWANSDRSDRLNRAPGYIFSAMKTSLVSFSINSTFPFPLKTNLRYSSNHSESALTDLPYDFYTFGAQGRYEFFNSALSLIAGGVLTSGKGQAEYTQSNVYGGFIFNFLKIHQLRSNISFTHLDDRTSDEKFNDLSFFVIYSMNF